VAAGMSSADNPDCASGVSDESVSWDASSSAGAVAAGVSSADKSDCASGVSDTFVS
jgi:hypothetical protein